MHVEAPEVPAYALEIVDTSAGSEVEIEVPFPSPDFIAAMDATRGEKVFKKCLSCHNADQGGANGTGPNLWNIVGQPAAQNSDFKYSSAMTGANLTWDYETLNDYLAKPTSFIKGTAMNFIGLKKEEDRAAVIEYMRLASSSPVARPEPAAAPVEDAAPVEEMVETIEDAVPSEESEVIEDVPAEDEQPEQSDE
jgi:cytochrome c